MTVRLEIKGKVQGVFFRATARKVAEKNDLKGWIKNKGNGDVEAVISGETENVNKFVEWSKKGPENAIVDEVIFIILEEAVFKDFNVKR